MRDHFELARSVLEDTVRLRRDIHQHPELSGQEYRTRELIANWLTSLDIPYTTYSNGGIAACIGSGGRAIGVRGDMDALPVQEATGLPYASRTPGVMHACGHDVNTAILLGAAKMFKSVEGELPCAVKLFFQPAEETVGGARVMIEEGCMAEPAVDAVLGVHVDPSVPVGSAAFLPGKMNAAIVELCITVRGKACHGARPEEGVDAIVAAAHIVTALQTVVSRMNSASTPVVVTIGTIQGGTAGNIVAGEVVMKGTVRVLDMETAARVKEQIRFVAASVAAAWGAQAEVELIDDYPALINDPALTRCVAQEAERLLGSDRVIYREKPSMGGDDFAYFSNAAKGCYFNIGTAEPGKPSQSLHSEYFAPHEDCMLTGLALVSAGVWRLMEKPL